MRERIKPPREQLIGPLADGLPVTVIADIYGVSSRSVQRWMTEYGLLVVNKPIRPMHGTAAMYTKGGCRCDACKQANTEHCARARGRRYARVVPDGHPHNARTYSNWGCRCELCTSAWSVAMKQQYERRKRDAA